MSSSTTTVWLDANPAETGRGTPPCPTGHWVVPLQNTEEVNECLPSGNPYHMTWSCMETASLGISVFDAGPGNPYQVSFDDYSVRPQLFKYGPQPPDFNGTRYDLAPMTDKDNSSLGVGMFFSHLTDKIIISK